MYLYFLNIIGFDFTGTLRTGHSISYLRLAEGLFCTHPRVMAHERLTHIKSILTRPTQGHDKG